MKLPRPVRSLAWAIGRRLIADTIRDAAAGKHGPLVAAMYQRFAGIKTWTGFVLGAVAIGLAAAGQAEAAVIVGSAAVLLQSVGLVDAAWRNGPPAQLVESRAYRFLASWSAELAAGLAAAGAAVATCSVETADLLARLRLTCEQGGALLLAAGAVLAWLGLYDAAAAAPAPGTDAEGRRIEPDATPLVEDAVSIDTPRVTYSKPVYSGDLRGYVVERTVRWIESPSSGVTLTTTSHYGRTPEEAARAAREAR